MVSTIVTTFPSNPLTALVVAVVLIAISRPIILRVASAEGKPWLVGILTASLLLHLAAAPAQIFVVDHAYHGIADYLRYDREGGALAPGFRHLNFSLAPGHLKGIVNDGSVSIAAGAVFAIVGVNKVAAFLVFSWFSFLGTLLFFRAFTLTFVGANHKRYAYLLFFLPSMIFWTADVSKEAIMMLSLGVVAYGAAKILGRRRGGIVLVAVGTAVGILVRPNELLVMMAGFTVAMMVNPASAAGRHEASRRIGTVLFFGALLGISVFLTLHYLHTGNGTLSLQQTAQNNSGTGAGFGSSGIPYSSSPLTYPRDIYEILFNPLPVTAHSFSQFLAAAENSVILIVILASWRQLRIVPRVAFARPYVMMCAIYSAGFIYTFAALGNLGLITRERVLLFPFLLVLLSIPRAPKGEPPRYEWEVRRRDRARFRAVMDARRRAALAQRPTSATTPAVPVGGLSAAGSGQLGWTADPGPGSAIDSDGQS
jgi:hypothetical protein